MFAGKQRAFVLGLLLVGGLLCTSGCVGFTNWLLWGAMGQKIPAEYDKLENERVAIVCATGTHSFEPGQDTGSIARHVSEILEREVKNIEIVDQEEIADWMDQTNWTQMDYREVGKGVKADKVVVIEFQSLSFQDNANEVRGRADYRVLVFDMKTGEQTLVAEQPEFVYPTHGPAGTTARRFKPLFIQRLSQAIAELFYDHDFTEGFGNDALAI